MVLQVVLPVVDVLISERLGAHPVVCWSVPVAPLGAVVPLAPAVRYRCWKQVGPLLLASSHRSNPTHVGRLQGPDLAHLLQAAQLLLQIAHPRNLADGLLEARMPLQVFLGF